jgi:hypothetical protein
MDGRARKMIINDTKGLGRIEVTDIPIPDFVRDASATYTYSGKVMIFYKTDSDSKVNDYKNIAVLKDDGTGFKKIFSGEIKEHEKANGLRHMPYQDNKRVLLGDYVLECSPDIDSCEKAELIPVEYPDQIVKDPRTMKHWSEIIIAPDNEHIAWTILRTDIGAANAIGVLVREEDKYIIKDIKIISTIDSFKKDEKNPEYIIPQMLRGGEIKQFVKGGAAISLAGTKKGGVLDSVVQDLNSEAITQITNTPGYDETTIFSPDELLGMVMSTRGSKRTNPAIFGLMPTPYSMFTRQGMIMSLYMYAVAGVRSLREGNVGPVLIDIEKSMNEKGYEGVLLNDPEEKWVYLSPMSWHTDGKKAMWPEMLRGSHIDDGGKRRIRKVELLDYEPQEPVSFVKTPEDIPYSIELNNISWSTLDKNIQGKIAGKHSGYMEYKRQGKEPMQGIMGSTEATYVNYSDDGKTFYNGFEKSNYSFMTETTFEANVEMTGEQEGEMKFRATFSKGDYNNSPRLLFEEAEDGKPKSYGYVRYGGVELNIEDLIE